VRAIGAFQKQLKETAFAACIYNEYNDLTRFTHTVDIDVVITFILAGAPHPLNKNKWYYLGENS